MPERKGKSGLATDSAHIRTFHSVRLRCNPWGARNGHPQVYYAEQGDPGEPIVLIHPHADSWFSFSRVLSLLPARNHAYALDQRGHGDSERPACCYTIDDLATDIVAFLDGVGITRATLVGHSASGFIARRLAETTPTVSPGWC
jgi:pimeloyl-ACP methyl ester carboxylesterase